MSTSPEEESRNLHVMKHSAVACDVYQTTDVTYLTDSELSNNVNCDSAVRHEKPAPMGPSSAHYGDQTEHKGDDRKGDWREALDEADRQSIDPEGWEWVSSQHGQEVN